MNYNFRLFLASCFLLTGISFTKGQGVFVVELNNSGATTVASKFYVADVMDGRKDSLKNGYAILNKKKVKIIFHHGAASEIKQYLEKVTPAADSLLLPLIFRISKLELTERPSAKGNIVKTDLTIQFLRKDKDEFIQLNELSSWMEQSAMHDASKLQEKNIRELLNMMLKQFDKMIAEQKSNPLFAPQIMFKVIHTGDENILDDTIYWDRNVKLKWDDFMGKPGTGEFAAQSNCAFSQNIEPKVEGITAVFYINARSAFFKKESWVKKDKAINEILAHEQLHFDIAEWQMRLLRKQLMNSDLSINHYTEIINQLYKKAWNWYNAMQTQYDDETAHGTIEAEQSRWAKQVENELNDLTNY